MNNELKESTYRSKFDIDKLFNDKNEAEICDKNNFYDNENKDLIDNDYEF